jgi:glycosyltransferase involved in cell wall biosynthesis
MATPPRILYYNWVPFDDDEKRGGGVSIYQRNLVEALVARGIPVDFFSAGLAYDLEDLTPRFVPTDNVFAPRARSFELVNSPVMSPGHSAFGQNARLFDRGPAFDAFLAFLRANGPYDILHFNNIEGIPFSFLDLKAECPDTRIVLSHHNYFAVCPQVNLWHREREHCTDYDLGRKCADCLVHRPPRSEILAAQQLSTMIKRAGLTAQSPVFLRAFRSEETPALLMELAKRNHTEFLQDDPLPVDPLEESGFARRRHRAVELLNRSVDLHLAVSERVARVIGSYGIDAAKTRVSYIGTKHGETLATANRRQALAKPGSLSMVFMGYMRADKGFYFLLDALEQLPPAIARNLRVKLAAKSVKDPMVEKRLRALDRHLGALEHIDGYAHADLPAILKDVDLGVVPVLWEDNLPQVALEIMSHGVPILTADRGGAQELAGNPDFTFAAGSTRAFAEAVRRLQTGEVALGSFWDRAMALRSMDDHLDELMAFYDQTRGALRAPAAARSAADAAPTETLLDDDALMAALPPVALSNWILTHA